MKIVISGIGGVGGYYGGLLARQFEGSKSVQIYFISRGENLKKIKTDGLTVKSTLMGEFTTHPYCATDDASQIGEADYLICATKSYDLEQNIKQLLPCIGNSTCIIPLLNGANISERIQRIVPHADVWHGCAYIIGRIPQPGLIIETTQPKEHLLFGSTSASKEKQNLLLNIFHKSGINASNPDNILETIWRKYMFISSAALCTSYYNSNYGDVRNNHLDTYVAMVNEIKAAAIAKGIILPESIVDDTIATIHRYSSEATTSMHTDFSNKRPVEIDNLGGYTLQLGQQYNIPMPIHQSIINELRQRIVSL